MIGIHLEWNPKLKAEQLAENIKKNKQKLNIALVEELRAGVMQNFTTESDDGKAWTPLAAVTLKRRKYKTLPMLVQHPAAGLKGSIQTQADENGGQIYTNKIYARALHFGFEPRKLPARPFMTITGQAKKNCADILKKWLQEQK